MSAVYLLPETQVDTIQRLYCAAEALRHISNTLPDECGGMGFLLELVSEEVQASARILDDGEAPLIDTNTAE